MQPIVHFTLFLLSQHDNVGKKMDFYYIFQLYNTTKGGFY